MWDSLWLFMQSGSEVGLYASDSAGLLQRRQEFLVYIMCDVLTDLGSALVRAPVTYAPPHAGVDDAIEGIIQRVEGEVSALARPDKGIRKRAAAEERGQHVEGRAG